MAEEFVLSKICYDYVMIQHNVIEAFSDKVLGVRNYEADKDEFYSTDFLDSKVLLEFLDEVSSGESDITPAGYVFLNQHFDIRKVAENARKDGIALPPYNRGKTDEERIEYFLNFIKNLKPMVTALFMTESEWKHDNEHNPTLDNIDEKLLPPKL